MSEKTMYIQDKRIDLQSGEQLSSLVDDFLAEDYQEVWMTGRGGSSLCVMTNPSNAFLMFLRHEGDSGFRSCNQAGDENKLEEFRLANGQSDTYPETWLIKKEAVKAILLTYFDEEVMDKSIDWVE